LGTCSVRVWREGFNDGRRWGVGVRIMIIILVRIYGLKREGSELFKRGF